MVCQNRRILDLYVTLKIAAYDYTVGDLVNWHMISLDTHLLHEAPCLWETCSKLPELPVEMANVHASPAEPIPQKSLVPFWYRVWKTANATEISRGELGITLLAAQQSSTRRAKPIREGEFEVKLGTYAGAQRCTLPQTSSRKMSWRELSTQAWS